MSSEKPFRILVAEDDRVFAEIIRFQLTHHGFDVTVVHDGEAGQNLARSQPFDLIVTDYQMPRKDGEFVCLGARSNPDNQRIPIFLCSAKGYEIDTERLRSELQVSEFFFKPFSPRELVEKAHQALDAQSPVE